MGMIVVTANLYNGRARPESIMALLERLRPDLLAVQELSPNQAAGIEALLPHGLLDPRDDHLGLGIASSTPIEVERLSMTYRDVWVGRHPRVEVINVHITSPLRRPIGESLRFRRRQLAELNDHLETRPAGPRLLVGDLNSTPWWPFYRSLRRLMEDGVAAVGPAARTWGPFPWAPAFLRIDHVFAQHVEVIRAATHRLAGGDHRAVEVEVAC